jgi:hypothetical protein
MGEQMLTDFFYACLISLRQQQHFLIQLDQPAQIDQGTEHIYPDNLLRLFGRGGIPRRSLELANQSLNGFLLFGFEGDVEAGYVQRRACGGHHVLF